MDYKLEDNKEDIDEKEASKEIRHLIGIKKYVDAIKLTEKYPLNPIIQAQRMYIEIKRKNYPKAEKIGNKREFINHPSIQSQMMTIAIEKKDYEKGEKIGNKKEFIDNPIIQSMMMTIAIKKGNFQKGKEIGNREEFINYPPIQSQMITIAIEEGNFQKGKAIGNKEEFINNPLIQSQMITIAIKEGNFQKGKEIGSREDFINNPQIQSQMIIIAMQEGDYQKVEEIGSRQEFINNRYIQHIVNIAKERSKFLNQIKTKMYYNKLQNTDIDEVKMNDKISKKQRVYVLLAIYEKQKNSNQAKKLVNEYKSKNGNPIDNKILNIIMQRIENKKKKFFDWGFYYNLLKWNMDEELKEKYEHEKELLNKVEDRDER